MQTEADWFEALDELGNEDIRKISKLIKAGEDLSGTPRISISTIHGVKGNERENVVINNRTCLEQLTMNIKRIQTIHTDCFMLPAQEQKTIYL